MAVDRRRCRARRVGFLPACALFPTAMTQLADLPAIQHSTCCRMSRMSNFATAVQRRVRPSNYSREAGVRAELKELENANRRRSKRVATGFNRCSRNESPGRGPDRNFDNLEPSPGEQERMRNIMADIRTIPERPISENADRLRTVAIASHCRSKGATPGTIPCLGRRKNKRGMVAKMTGERRATLVSLTADDADKLRARNHRFARREEGRFSQKMIRNHRADCCTNQRNPRPPL